MNTELFSGWLFIFSKEIQKFKKKILQKYESFIQFNKFSSF